MNEIVLDTETTGLSVKDGHRIFEIACIETENLIPTKRVFYKLINPEREISADASRIHGYTYEILKNKEKFEDIAKEFKDFILSIQVMDFEGNVYTIPSSKINFFYRGTDLKNDLIFLSASFKGNKKRKNKYMKKLKD